MNRFSIKHVANLIATVAFATGIGAVGVGSALGQDHERRTERPAEHHAQQHRKVERHDERGNRYGYRDGYRGPDYVYAPPPVVYDPHPSPGINLFFSF